MLFNDRRIEEKLSANEVAIYRLELKIEALTLALNNALGVATNVTERTYQRNFDRLQELQAKLDAQVGTVSGRDVRIPPDLRNMVRENNDT